MLLEMEQDFEGVYVCVELGLGLSEYSAYLVHFRFADDIPASMSHDSLPIRAHSRAMADNLILLIRASSWDLVHKWAIVESWTEQRSVLMPRKNRSTSLITGDC